MAVLEWTCVGLVFEMSSNFEKAWEVVKDEEEELPPEAPFHSTEERRLNEGVADRFSLERVAELEDELMQLQKRNEWLEEVVALAQEHGAIDLTDYGSVVDPFDVKWPQWMEGRGE